MSPVENIVEYILDNYRTEQINKIDNESILEIIDAWEKDFNYIPNPHKTSKRIARDKFAQAIFKAIYNKANESERKNLTKDVVNTAVFLNKAWSEWVAEPKPLHIPDVYDQLPIYEVGDIVHHDRHGDVVIFDVTKNNGDYNYKVFDLWKGFSLPIEVKNSDFEHQMFGAESKYSGRNYPKRIVSGAKQIFTGKEIKTSKDVAIDYALRNIDQGYTDLKTNASIKQPRHSIKTPYYYVEADFYKKPKQIIVVQLYGKLIFKDERTYIPGDRFNMAEIFKEATKIYKQYKAGKLDPKWTKKEQKLINLFGQHSLGRIMNVYDDIVDLYVVPSYRKGFRDYIFKSIGASKMFKNHFWMQDKYGNIHLTSDWDYPATIEEVEEFWGRENANEWASIIGEPTKPIPDGTFEVWTKGMKAYFDIYLNQGKLSAKFNRYAPNVNEKRITPIKKSFQFESGADLKNAFKGSVVGSLKISEEVQKIMFPGTRLDDWPNIRPDKQEKSKKMSKPQKIKIGDQEFDCDDLVAEERERLAKKRASAKKSAKKPESKKNTKRLDKTTDTIKENIKDRIDDGKKPSKREIVALISKTRDLKAKLVKLKEQL